MSRRRGHRLREIIRSNAWWATPPLAIAVAGGFLLGWWMALPLVALNVSGVWLYADGVQSERGRRRALWLKWLAIPLLPVGIFAVLATDDGLRPSDGLGSGDDDHDVLKAAVRTPPPPFGSP